MKLNYRMARTAHVVATVILVLSMLGFFGCLIAGSVAYKPGCPSELTSEFLVASGICSNTAVIAVLVLYILDDIKDESELS